ncbi:MAG: phosphate signaling complex protein PhoU [Chitinivibrionia bacterium]|nr:phosphate signaling complex protein PhoU [Chitinivibrionia bacterium]
MRESYKRQLEKLRCDMTEMGALCEYAINSTINGLVTNNSEMRKKTFAIEEQIDNMEREISRLCIILLIREQPVAGDLRFITTTQKLIGDMERIGANAASISYLFENASDEQRHFVGKYMEEMAKSVAKIISNAVDCLIKNDVEEAKNVIMFDIVINNHFKDIKQGLIKRIDEDGKNGELCLDIFQAAKYLERIGDHAKNIAKVVAYSIQEA